MIIELAPSFNSFSTSQWGKYQAAIENLLNAHVHGWHYFAPRRAVAESILKSCQLSARQAGILEHYLINRNAVVLGQAQSANLSVLALPVGGCPHKREERHKIQVSLDIVSSSYVCMPICILVEDIENDGNFIELLCSALKRRLNRSWSSNWEILHGGGGRTPVIWNQICKNGRAAVCIVDSDKRSPFHKKSDTASKINEVIRQQYQIFIEIPVREMENLVPINFIKKAYSDNKEVLARISVLEEVYNFDKTNGRSGIDACIYYIDYKEGFKRSDLEAMCTEGRTLYMAMWKHVMPLETAFKINFADEKDNVIFGGVSKTMLRHVSHYIQANGKNRSEFIESIQRDDLYSSVENMVTQLIDFTACAERLPF